MQDLPNEFQERLKSEALTLCTCWILTRRDGLVLRLTDHDLALTIEGEVFEPGASIDAGRFVRAEGVKPGQAAGVGALSSDAVTEEDLLAGLWDGCRIEVFQVDWRAPELGTRHLWNGFLSEIQFNASGAFEAELVSLKADLERPIGRVIQRRCDAQLGDARCRAESKGRTCDQRFETCRDVFQNTENFRGFPHMPGNDFVLAGPAAAGNDGSKR